MKALIVTALIGAQAVVSTAFAGGGGSGWTQCSVNDLGLSYSFDGYTQSLSVGKRMTVFTQKNYGYYQIDSIDTQSKVGVIQLSHVPSNEAGPVKDMDFGKMKIEYFSNSALKDIRVTFSKDGRLYVGNALCYAD